MSTRKTLSLPSLALDVHEDVLVTDLVRKLRPKYRLKATPNGRVCIEPTPTKETRHASRSR